MIADDVQLGKQVVIHHPELVNLYGCVIGNETRIGTFVEIQKNSHIGAKCKIQSHTFICEGVTIEEGVFVGHGVMFINDHYPKATNPDGTLQTEKDWKLLKTCVKKNVTIGSNVSILGGITIGEGALIGAGAVVTKNVLPYAVVVGNPAKQIGDTRKAKK